MDSLNLLPLDKELGHHWKHPGPCVLLAKVEEDPTTCNQVKDSSKWKATMSTESNLGVGSLTQG